MQLLLMVLRVVVQYQLVVERVTGSVVRVHLCWLRDRHDALGRCKLERGDLLLLLLLLLKVARAEEHRAGLSDDETIITAAQLVAVRLGVMRLLMLKSMVLGRRITIVVRARGLVGSESLPIVHSLGNLSLMLMLLLLYQSDMILVGVFHLFLWGSFQCVAAAICAGAAVGRQCFCAGHREPIVGGASG